MSEDQVKENQPLENKEQPMENSPPQTTGNVSNQAETIQENQPEETLLLPRDTLLSAGIHIGTRMKTLDM